MRPKVGVGVYIFKDSKVLLGLRTGSHGAETWCPPGGHLEFGEQIFNCAARETEEEVGIEFTNPIISDVTTDVFSSEKQYITIAVFADYLSGEPEIKEPEKCREWKWFSTDKLPDNLFLPVKNYINKNGGLNVRIKKN